MRTTSLLVSLSILSLSLSSMSFAGPISVGIDPTVETDQAPNKTPSGSTAPNGGYFSQYFQNLANSDCPSGQIVTAFDNNPSTYLKPTCSGISSVLSGYFSSLGLSANSPIVFNTNGTASNLDMNTGSLTSTMITNLFSNNNYTSALTTWVNNNSNSLSLESQWKNVTGGISYTGGNIGIGTENLSFGKLYVNGKTVIGDIGVDYLPNNGNPWNFTLQLSGYPTTSIGFYDAQHTSGGSMKYTNAGFVIGGDDGGGWGVKPAYFPGNIYLGDTVGLKAQIGYNANILYPGIDIISPNSQTHIMNTSGGYGDLFARNIHATNNISASGSIYLDNSQSICFGGTCYNSTNIGGGGSSQWSNGAGPSIYYTGGYVGIGTASPSYKLDVTGNARVSGTIEATGFLYSSDRNLKKDIKPLEGSLEKILKLSGYSYNWKSTGRTDIGVIAQEVEGVYPDLVHTDAKGVKSVEYANLVAPLIEAIKEQQKEIDALKSEVANLKK